MELSRCPLRAGSSREVPRREGRAAGLGWRRHILGSFSPGYLWPSLGHFSLQPRLVAHDVPRAAPEVQWRCCSSVEFGTKRLAASRTRCAPVTHQFIQFPSSVLNRIAHVVPPSLDLPVDGLQKAGGWRALRVSESDELLNATRALHQSLTMPGPAMKNPKGLTNRRVSSESKCPKIIHFKVSAEPVLH